MEVIVVKRVIGIILLICMGLYSFIYLFIDNSFGNNDGDAEILLFYSIVICLIFVILKKYIMPKVRKISVPKIKTPIIETKKEKAVKTISKNYQEVLRLNHEFDFEPIDNNKLFILNREYSLKSYDRAQFEEVLRYNIENNIDDIRTEIKKAINNENLYNLYSSQVSNINFDLDESYIEEEIGISKKSFIKLEQKLINRIKITQDVYNITCDVEIYYRSPKGRNNYSKRHIFSYYELVDIYNDWLNGKKYEVTSKIERQIMNEDIRYNVLIRDNFTCVLCGATAKDGAKLQVDHIIPVSKGGKTVMSNLQTLCEKCNKGKNNKVNSEDICPVCGGALMEKKGKYGVFIGCSNYPKCHYTKEK